MPQSSSKPQTEDSPPVKSVGRRILFTLMFLVVLAALASAGVFLWAKQQFQGAGPLKVEKTVVIPKGMGLKSIGTLLEKEGIVAQPAIMVVGARLLGEGIALKAGEYLFPAHVSQRNVLSILTSGKTVLRRFTIAEGLTSVQIIEELSNVDGLSGNIIFGVPPEGALLPETYYFSYGEDRQDVIERMRLGMVSLLAKLWTERDGNLPLSSPDEALILASIVEKETGVDGERAKVAGVFINRLRKKMRLQSDPTVVYGITNGQQALGRSLTRTDLKTATPYNTYTIKGLPPGPIANPGRAALEAVLHPADTKALYFVANGSGGHAFSNTLDEHNRNVRKWRKIEAATQ